MSKILVLNAGSSSLKYQVIDMQDEKVMVKGLCERIGIDGGTITHKINGQKIVTNVEMADHTVALNHVLDSLVDEKIGCIKSLDEIDAVGHRVLHGGEFFSKAAIIDRDVLAKIIDLIPLGPLHQHANLQGIYACQKLMPDTPQVAVFDTAFHSTMPQKAFMYAIPVEDYTKYHIRKYGFHGTSHKFVSQKLAELTGKKGKFIVFHIGNGASLSAVNNGICQDTSMGYTPLDGCMMGTRSGSVDASILPVLCEKHKMTINEAITYLNKSSGLLGVAGYADARDVQSAAENKNDAYTSKQIELAQLAEEMRAYIDAKIAGGYVAAMNGVDAIAFTAGIGENDEKYRARVLGYFSYLGIKVDSKLNVHGAEGLISAPDSAVKVYVIPTNEELQIAKETKEELGL